MASHYHGEHEVTGKSPRRLQQVMRFRPWAQAISLDVFETGMWDQNQKLEDKEIRSGSSSSALEAAPWRSGSHPLPSHVTRSVPKEPSLLQGLRPKTPLKHMANPRSQVPSKPKPFVSKGRSSRSALEATRERISVRFVSKRSSRLLRGSHGSKGCLKGF